MLVSQVGGNTNQFKVYMEKGVIFQSYSTLISFRDLNGKVYLTSDWDYSKTTLKHLKIFLGIDLSVKDIRAKIAKGDYILVNSEKELLELAK